MSRVLKDHDFLLGVCSICQKLQFKEMEVYLQPTLVSSYTVKEFLGVPAGTGCGKLTSFFELSGLKRRGAPGGWAWSCSREGILQLCDIVVQ
jgi:hypothetical protein